MGVNPLSFAARRDLQVRIYDLLVKHGVSEPWTVESVSRLPGGHTEVDLRHDSGLTAHLKFQITGRYSH